MRINFFVRSMLAGIGGMEVHAHDFIASARQRGWLVDIFVSGNLPAEIPEADVFFFNDLSFLYALPQLRIRFPHTRFVLRSGGNDLWHFSGAAEILNGNIDMVVVNSDFSFHRSLSFGLDPWRMVKIRGGVPNLQVRRLLLARGSLRVAFDEKYGTRGKRLLAFVCRMERFKGVVELLHALACIWHDSWHIVMVGAGRMDEEVRQVLKREFRDCDYVTLGSLSHDRALETIALSDVLLAPSLACKRILDGGTFWHTETMGRAIMEAMTVGVEVIATDAGAIRELDDEFPGSVRLARDISGMLELLQTEYHGIDRLPEKLSAYGWDALIEKYESIFYPSRRRVYSFDYDGTLVGDGDDQHEIAQYLRSHRGESFFILNTARKLDDDLVEFAKESDIDCIIACNGLDIVDVRGLSRWQSWGRWSHQFRASNNDLAAIADRLRQDFKKVSLKQVYCNSMVVRKDGAVDESELRSCVVDAIGSLPYHICESQRNIKVVHNLFGKSGAASYILKDFPGYCIYGAGNGMEDMDLLKHCKRGFSPILGERRKDFLARVFSP